VSNLAHSLVKIDSQRLRYIPCPEDIKTTMFYQDYDITERVSIKTVRFMHFMLYVVYLQPRIEFRDSLLDYGAKD